MKTKSIYFDNNATTSIDPRVLEEILKTYDHQIGNPSSIHQFGQRARSLLQKARRDVAEFFSVKNGEVTFTSGGTEAIGWIIRDFVEKNPHGHIITSIVEHSAVIKTLKNLESKHPITVTYLSVDESGCVSPESLREAIREETSLIFLMAANNETGIISDVEGLAAVAKEANVPFCLDAVGCLGKEPVKLPQGLTALVLSAHKIYGPSGVGCTIVRRPHQLSPMITGGGQENNRRSGTENLSGIVGLAKALCCLKEDEAAEIISLRNKRDRFEKELREQLDGVHVNGKGSRLSNTSNLAFDGVDGESLFMTLDLEGLAASLGSACSAGGLEPSRVLTAMGYSPERCAGSIRFSFGRFTTEEDITRGIEIIVKAVNHLR
jgi:cysteine desulfurase